MVVFIRQQLAILYDVYFGQFALSHFHYQVLLEPNYSLSKCGYDRVEQNSGHDTGDVAEILHCTLQSRISPTSAALRLQNYYAPLIRSAIL